MLLGQGIILVFGAICVIWAVLTGYLNHTRLSAGDFLDEFEGKLYRSDGSNPGGQIFFALFVLCAVTAAIFFPAIFAISLFDLERPLERVMQFFLMFGASVIGLIAMHAMVTGARWQQPIRASLRFGLLAIGIAALVPAAQATVYWWVVSHSQSAYEFYLNLDMQDEEPQTGWRWRDARQAKIYILSWPDGPQRARAQIVIEEAAWHYLDRYSDDPSGSSKWGPLPYDELAAYLSDYPDGQHAEDVVLKIDLGNIGRLTNQFNKTATELFGELVEPRIWAMAQNEPSVFGYRIYLDQFPKGPHAEDSQQEIDRHVWEITVAAGTIRQFQEFREDHPNSGYLAELDRRVAELRNDPSVWEPVRISARIEDIDRFLTDFPGHQNTQDALDLIKGTDFRDLVERNIIEVSFNGCGLIEYVCGTIKNLTDSGRHVAFYSGTLLVSNDPASQSIAIVRNGSVLLDPNESTSFRLSAACANIALKIPATSVGFTFAAKGASGDLSDIRAALNSSGADWDTKQAMVWIVTDNASRNMLRTRLTNATTGASVISDDEITRALEFLADAGYPVHSRSALQD